ncbi:MAG: hypothetical protein ACK5MA_09985 [Parachlamydiaceae bacterium]
MKRHSLKTAALLGLASGLTIAGQLQAEAKATDSKAAEISDPNAGNLGYHLYTEEELLVELNDEGYKLYMSLTPEGKALAREVASMRCQGSNICKGLNACATDNNACAGKGSCKGKGKCGLSDKNLAVKLVAKKMNEKRTEALTK